MPITKTKHEKRIIKIAPGTLPIFVINTHIHTTISVYNKEQPNRVHRRSTAFITRQLR